jgi:hypothetical protein
VLPIPAMRGKSNSKPLKLGLRLLVHDSGRSLGVYRVSRRFQVRKGRLLRLPGDLGRLTNRPKRHFLACQQQKQQSLQCRLASMARSPHRPRRLWLCRLQIGRPRIPVHHWSALTLRLTAHSKKEKNHRLNLARIHLHNPNPRRDQFSPQTVCKYPHCCLRRTVNAPA